MVCPRNQANLIVPHRVDGLSRRHRKDIRSHLGSGGTAASAVRSIMALLVESGFLYCITWVSRTARMIYSSDVKYIWSSRDTTGPLYYQYSPAQQGQNSHGGSHYRWYCATTCGALKPSALPLTFTYELDLGTLPRCHHRARLPSKISYGAELHVRVSGRVDGICCCHTYAVNGNKYSPCPDHRDQKKDFGTI